MASFFEKIPDNKLSQYLKYVRKTLNGRHFDYEDITSFDYTLHVQNEKLVNQLFKPIMSSWSRYDVEYLFYLYTHNDEGSETINRPQLKNYSIDYKEVSRKTVHEYWESRVDSYYDISNDYSYIYDLQTNGSVDFYGELYDTQERDTDYSDGEIEDVTEI